MPDDTIWELLPHTQAKHIILRKYLGAWFPKLTSWQNRVVFVDGFAGPGEYVGGEPGSPIVALTTAAEHKHDMTNKELLFLFIDADKRRYEHLVGKINALKLPDHIKVGADHGEFVDKFGEVLDRVEEGNGRLAPALVMVDPFGLKGMPLEFLARITAHERSELLVSFMYEPIVRFRNELPEICDQLFGCPDWRHADDLATARERRDFLHGLYVSQLRTIGMKYVRSFQMLDDWNRTEYFLIFGTKHIEGLKAMKRAMWSVDPTGRFQFSDATQQDQPTLFVSEPDFSRLEKDIRAHFPVGQAFTIESLELFVWEETAFLDSHIRRPVLIPAEAAGKLEVLTDRNRKNTYPAGTVMRFTD